MKKNSSLACTTLVILMVGSVLLLNFVESIKITRGNQICIAIDAVEILISAILLYGFALEQFSNKLKQDTATDLLCGEVLLLISDIVARCFLGYPNKYLLYALCTIPYLIMSVEIYLYWLMLYYIVEDQSLKKYDVIIKAISIMCVIIVMLNLPIHYIFKINDAFYYQRSNMYWICMFGPAIVFGIIYYALKHSKSYENTKLLLFYIIVPIVVSNFCKYVALVYTGLLCSMVLIYIDFHYHRQIKMLKNKELLLEKENALQEYSTKEMISQIQPHFIYNTLGSISALCAIDPDKAAEVTNEFAKYFRSNIDTLNQHETVSFRTELDHIQTYVYLEKVRFEDLDVEIKIENDEFNVPALSIQPLVENAIKHGVMGQEEGGKVMIEEIETPSGHQITIKDSGSGFDTGSLTGSYGGISNSKNRIAMMVHGTLDVKSAKELGTVVTILIPYEDE